jgi:hypothetical protein
VETLRTEEVAMPTLISLNTEIDQAIADEQSLPPGNYEVRFNMPNIISRQEVQEIKIYLEEQGVDVGRVYQSKSEGIPYLGIQYKKNAPEEGITFLPIAVIPLIGLGLILTVISIGIFKLEDIAKVLMVGGGILIVSLALLRQPLTTYVERN